MSTLANVRVASAELLVVRCWWSSSRSLPGLLQGGERVFGPAARREIPAHDLPRAAVDHADQVRPAHGGPRPDLGHVRLPDLIRLGGFHTDPLFLPASPQTTGAHQQPTFSHHPQDPFAIHREVFFSPQPPSHPAISIRRFFPARHDDLFVVLPIGPTTRGRRR